MEHGLLWPRMPGAGRAPELMCVLQSRLAASRSPVEDGSGVELLARFCHRRVWALPSEQGCKAVTQQGGPARPAPFTAPSLITGCDKGG